MRALADAIRAAPRLAHADLHLALAAEALGDVETAVHRHQLSLSATRENGDRTHAVASLQRIGVLHCQIGDPAAALPWLAQAQTVYQALEDAGGECVAASHAALCQARLGQTTQAESTVVRLLERLQGELAAYPAHETIELRWTCYRVLEARADAQTRATELTDATDRERLIQDLPVFRDIVAAHGRRGRQLPR